MASWVNHTAAISYLRTPQEYKATKDKWLDTTRKSGGAVAAYLFLMVDGEAALCALLGMAFSQAYLLWLFYDVDNVKGTDRVPWREAMQVENPVLRKVAQLFAAYQHALRPRLLVPVLLAALTVAYAAVADEPLGLTYKGCLLLGFFSHKIALIIKVADDLSPKSYNADQPNRPMVERIEDELDQWGRPKKQLRLPTDALPENLDVNKLPPIPLLELEEESKKQQ